MRNVCVISVFKPPEKENRTLNRKQSKESIKAVYLYCMWHILAIIIYIDVASATGYSPYTLHNRRTHGYIRINPQYENTAFQSNIPLHYFVIIRYDTSG